MIKKFLPLVFLVSLSPAAHSDTAAEGAVATRPITGDYTIYSGTLGEIGPPTAADRKLAIAIRGGVAKDVFESIKPDAKAHCCGEKGERLRKRGNCGVFTVLQTAIDVSSVSIFEPGIASLAGFVDPLRAHLTQSAAAVAAAADGDQLRRHSSRWCSPVWEAASWPCNVAASIASVQKSAMHTDGGLSIII